MEGYKFIDKIGIEIEGLWKIPRTDLVPDASLHAEDWETSYYRDENSGRKMPLFGELVSQPLENKEVALAFIKDNWPDEISPRCGFHMHVSFNSYNLYCHAMTRQFYHDFLIEVEKWGRKVCPEDIQFIERLQDRNRYCRRRFIPDEQVKCLTKDSARQRQLRATHFNYCYGQHKTLECRLFPMWKDYVIAQSAVCFYLDFIENFLSKIPNVTKDLIYPEVIFIDEEENFPAENTLNTIKLPKFNFFNYKKNGKMKYQTPKSPLKLRKGGWRNIEELVPEFPAGVGINPGYINPGYAQVNIIGSEMAAVAAQPVPEAPAPNPEPNPEPNPAPNPVPNQILPFRYQPVVAEAAKRIRKSNLQNIQEQIIQDEQRNARKKMKKLNDIYGGKPAPSVPPCVDERDDVDF